MLLGDSCGASFEFQGVSSSETADSWEWKLNALLRDNDKLEVISREKKDRRDFEQIATLASRMGLHRYLFSCDTYVKLLYFFFYVY